MSVSVSADLSGIGSYIGAVKGTLEALEDPAFHGKFLGSLTNEIKKKFMADAVSANLAGEGHISHMFEWGTNEDGFKGTSSKPLFALTKSGGTEHATLSFKFLPSTEFVPLPDPSKYGFPASKLDNMKRHVFREKALVMETRGQVVIKPKTAKRLFIPDASSPQGYVMTSSPVTVNPGGPQATGGFGTYWNQWFDGRAKGIVVDFTRQAEEIVAATGRKVIRYKAGTRIGGVAVGGRFASSETVSMSYVEGVAQSSRSMVEAELNSYYNNEGDWT